MKENYMEIIGFLAGTCTTLAFVPQVYKVWKLRSTKDISLGMYVIFCIGLVLWIVYGAWLHSYSLIGANVITLLLASAILYMKARERP